MNTHAHRALALCAVLAGAASFLSAQVVCYETNLGTSAGTGDDVVLPIQPIGFAFPFNGVTYTDLYPCTNGFLYLTNGGTPAAGGALCCTGTTAALVAAAGPMIAPRWDDLVVNGGVYVNQLPGKCVITWQNAIEFGNLVTFTMQCQLYSSGMIEFYYDGNTGTHTSGNALIGFSPGANATVPPASDLSVPGTSAVSTIFQLFDISGGTLAWDLTSRAVVFTPTGPTSYVWTQLTCGAMNVSYGAGCYNSAASFYEFFPAATFDLSGQTLTLQPASPGYVVSSAPLSSFFTPVAPSLGLTDDSLSPAITLPAAFPYPGGSTTSIIVHSNGQVFLNAPAVADYDPEVADFLLNGANLGVWNDFNPAAPGSGNIHVDIDAVNLIAYVTWNGVYNFGTTLANTWQVALWLSGSASPGKAEMRFQSFNNTSTLSQVAICGFTPGASANDPGTRDISATVPFVTPGEIHALTLSAAPAPTLGTPVTWTVGNVPATAYFSAHVMNYASIAAPGLDLGYLGAAGCNQLIALGGASSLLIYGAPTATLTITMPTNPSWIGVSVFSQGASFVPGVNPLGVLTSNAIQTTLF
jgi:hypothetical protein